MDEAGSTTQSPFIMASQLRDSDPDGESDEAVIDNSSMSSSRTRSGSSRSGSTGAGASRAQATPRADANGTTAKDAEKSEAAAEPDSEAAKPAAKPAKPAPMPADGIGRPSFTPAGAASAASAPPQAAKSSPSSPSTPSSPGSALHTAELLAVVLVELAGYADRSGDRRFGRLRLLDPTTAPGARRRPAGSRPTAAGAAAGLSGAAAGLGGAAAGLASSVTSAFQRRSVSQGQVGPRRPRSAFAGQASARRC